MNINDVIKIVCEVVFECYQLCGKTSGKEIDYIATRKFDKLLGLFPEICVLGIEGERDGIFFSELQKSVVCGQNATQIAIDPVDGTKTCAMGGSRALSALAIKDSQCRKYKKVIDQLSCFYVACNTDKTFLDILYDIGNVQQDIRNRIKALSCISTLRRKESEDLWKYLRGEPCGQVQLGENTYYMQSRIVDNLFQAGDTSIPLFLESDYFIGRTGSSEAIIEARLWKYWKGLFVSGKKIKEYSGGIVEYLQCRINAALEPEKFNIYELFEVDEVERMRELGWEDAEILGILSPEDFAPDYDVIIIGSITGTKDRMLTQHSMYNLPPARWNETNNKFIIPIWMKTNFYLGMVEYYYDAVTGEIEWKKIAT